MFTPIVSSRFGVRVAQEWRYPTLIVMQTDSIQQPLIVLVLQRAMTHVVGELLLELFGPSLEIIRLAGPLVTPELAGAPEYFLQFQLIFRHPSIRGESGLEIGEHCDVSCFPCPPLLRCS
jgi:hypothetical protein